MKMDLSAILAWRKAVLRAKAAFTLVEMVLAIAIIAIIMLSVAQALDVALQSWQVEENKNELLQHGRVAVERMLTELRYANRVNNATTSALQFEAENFTDTDSGNETYWYRLMNDTSNNQVLMRSFKDDGAGVFTDTTIAEYASAFSASYDGTDEIVTVSLTLTRNSQTITLGGKAYLRNNFR